MKKQLIVGAALAVAIGAFCGNSVYAANPYVDSGVPITKDYGVKDVTSDRDLIYRVKDIDWYKTSQPCLEIDFANWGLTSSEVSAHNYSTIVLIIELDIAEIYDGYQEIYLATNKYDKNSLQYSYTTLEHTTGKRDPIYKRYEFYVEIPASVCKYKYYLHFGAHGYMDDDWTFKAVQAQVFASTETFKIPGLCYVVNANTYYYT